MGLLESRSQTDAVKDANKERDAQLAQLKRRVNDLTARLETRTKEQEDKRLALQESEMRCHRLRREIYESEMERKRVLGVVRKVLERFEEAATPNASLMADMLQATSSPSLASSIPSGPPSARARSPRRG